MFISGKITCDCLNYTTKSLCAHVLATAQKNGVLKNLLDWYNGEKKRPNLWSLARSSGVPKHPGDKPNSTKRKRSRASRQLPKTSSKPWVPKTGKDSPSTSNNSPGASPNPKRSSYSGNSVSVTVSQTATNSKVLTSLNWQGQPSPPDDSTLGSQSESYSQQGGSLTGLGSQESLASGSEWPCMYGRATYLPYNPSPPWYQTPAFPSAPPYIPYGHYMGYHPEPSNSFIPPPNVFSSPPCVSRHTELGSPSVRGQFTLKFINSRISKCQGCKGQLRSPGTPLPLPPHDLIVSRLECRPYMTPEKIVKTPKTPSNAHYHLRVECLRAADPQFSPRCLVVPEDVKDQLSAQHNALLASFFSA